IYLQASIIAGVSTSLLSAMGAGKCIVASDLPENRLVLGDAGEYFEPNNPQSLAARLRELATDPVRARRKSELARRRAEEQFDWSAIVAKLVKVYESL